jgi:hypothetical protein
VAIVPVKKAPLLMAMHGIIRGIQITHHLLRWRGMCLQQELDEPLLHRLRVDKNLFVPGFFGGSLGSAQLQPVARAVARQGLAAVARPRPPLPGGVRLVDEHRQQRIMAEAGVIVEVFVAQGQGVDPLFDEVLYGVLDPRWRALIRKAGGKAVQEAGLVFNCAQEQCPAVRRDIAAMKAGDDRSYPQRLEGIRRFAPLCQRKVVS